MELEFIMQLWVFQLHIHMIHFPHPSPFSLLDKINILINLHFVFKVTSWYDSSWMCIKFEEDLYSTNSTGKAHSFAMGVATASHLRFHFSSYGRVTLVAFRTCGMKHKCYWLCVVLLGHCLNFIWLSRPGKEEAYWLDQASPCFLTLSEFALVPPLDCYTWCILNICPAFSPFFFKYRKSLHKEEKNPQAVIFSLPLLEHEFKKNKMN